MRGQCIIFSFIKLAGRPGSGGPLFCVHRRADLLAAATLASATTLVSILISTLIATSAHGLSSVSHSSHQCAITQGAIIEAASIQAVTDGDTVVLTDGRRVRVIGINAPELSKQSERSLRTEAAQARDLLTELIQNNPAVELVLGLETADRYGRILAHVSFMNGSSIASVLLAQGLAAATAVSPNTRCADYYQRIEQSARAQNRGVWEHDNNPWFANGVEPPNITGFHILTGNVERVRQNKNGVTITLDRGVTVRAASDVLSKADIEELGLMADNKRAEKNRDKTAKIGASTVEVRGWFGRYNGTTSVNLHHRSNLTMQR